MKFVSIRQHNEMRKLRAEGWTIRAISVRFDVTENTVRNHLYDDRKKRVNILSRNWYRKQPPERKAIIIERDKERKRQKSRERKCASLPVD